MSILMASIGKAAVAAVLKAMTVALVAGLGVHAPAGHLRVGETFRVQAQCIVAAPTKHDPHKHWKCEAEGSFHRP